MDWGKRQGGAYQPLLRVYVIGLIGSAPVFLVSAVGLLMRISEMLS